MPAVRPKWPAVAYGLSVIDVDGCDQPGEEVDWLNVPCDHVLPNFEFLPNGKPLHLCFPLLL
ncbi:hypothetical protein L484_027850 [Morus notabilis]|uniref:Uncharacterized protein n=1 Tax=Morus notabilis TaxID=981085 RepID=W9S1Z3_9ROSA|nr:hypothetical protein L484_027850 [Morus notabilis]